MFKVVKIENKPIPMQSNGLTFRLYTRYFGRDLLTDIYQMDDAIEKGKDVNVGLSTIADQLTWVLAKSANKAISDIDEWLEQFEKPTSVIEAMENTMELLKKSTDTQVELKKNQKKKKKKKKNTHSMTS